MRNIKDAYVKQHKKYEPDNEFQVKKAVEEACAEVLPSSTVADQGKALFVDNTGKPTWESLPKAANQAASEASTIATLKADFNTLLAALKTAGMMAADPTTTE